MKEPQRIAKLLARAGVASRRDVERMIGEGRIAIGGVAIGTPATLVTSLHGVTVDGQPVSEPAPTRLFLFHKPAGVLTAARDPKGRATIYDKLPAELPRVMPVGRLDFNTEGLLLLTTDGGFKRQLELPANGVERTYRARAHGEVSQEALESLSEGIEIDGIRYGSIDANLERRTGANVWIEMRLREGKNREVRRVLEHLGLEVNRLIRVSYGEFVLADLAPGGVVEVRQHDLVAFRKGMRDAPAIRIGEGAAEAPRPKPARRAAGTVRPAASAPRRPSAVASDAPRAPAARAKRPPVGAAARPHDRPRTTSGMTTGRAQPVAMKLEPQPQEDAPRAARPKKGKGWAKASKPPKRVGASKRPAAKRPDRPMTDERLPRSDDEARAAKPRRTPDKTPRGPKPAGRGPKRP